MILIADSGSTKTDWRVIKGDKQVVGFNTTGLSPFFVETETVIKEIENNFPCDILPSDVAKVEFYGTGCSSDDRKKIVADALEHSFIRAELKVATDMEGAALAMLGDEPGIAAILGTGSNTCFWDGTKIVKSTPSLGYILGDEGSGADLGKTLISQFLNGELPTELEERFITKYRITKTEVLNRLYKGTSPNAFLAGFASFWADNISHPFVVYTVSNCFLNFFEKHIHKYQNYSDYKFCCVGSIAYYFRDILEECALINNIDIDKIVCKPIDELTKYYITHINH